jgi:hypothetical protein
VSINLRHKGCGGFYMPWGQQGLSIYIFECEKCRDQIRTPCEDDASKARHDAEDAKREAQYQASRAALPPPPEPIRKATLMEALILGAYREWSENNHCAGFLSPTEGTAREFVEHLKRRNIDADYEEALCRLVAPLLKEAAPGGEEGGARWTRTVPAEPGFYWRRSAGGTDIVKVAGYDLTDMAQIYEPARWEWSGPLAAPADAEATDGE